MPPLNKTSRQDTAYISIPVKDTDAANGFKMEKYPIIYPHSVIDYLWNHGGLRIPPEKVAEYWAHLRQFGDPYAVNSEASSSHIPLGLFGDGARVTTTFDQESLVGIFMSIPLWRPRSVRAGRFLLFAIKESELYMHHTLNTIFRSIVWSCNSLWDSRHPTVDLHGQPLTGKLAQVAGNPICADCFAVTEIRGDWSWLKKIFRFANKTSWNGLHTCHLCPARSAGGWDQLYWNFDGAWTRQEFSLCEFFAHRMPEAGVCALHYLLGCILCSGRFKLRCVIEGNTIQLLRMLFLGFCVQNRAPHKQGLEQATMQSHIGKDLRSACAFALFPPGHVAVGYHARPKLGRDFRREWRVLDALPQKQRHGFV